MTPEEYFEEELDREKAERIAEYFKIPIGDATYCATKDNELICFGKFDPINIDDLGNKLTDVKLGEKRFKNKTLNKAVDGFSSYSSKRLRSLLSGIDPGNSPRKLFYLANMRLSELGIAPRWRNMSRVRARPARATWTDSEVQYMRDMQVFDLEWLYRTYPKHRVSTFYEHSLQKLMKQDAFDYGLAHMVSAAEITAAKKAAALKLTPDMQAEMSVLRAKAVERNHQALLKKVNEVEQDLYTAANRNRSRGQKLINAIPDRLKLWQAAMMTIGSSESLMLENYTKLTGDSINRSTFRSRFKSMNAALIEVNSKHAF